MISDDFCFLSAWFCYAIINVRNLESLMHIAYRRSRSHITTDGQSASSSWCLAPFGAGDQMLHLFKWQFLYFSCRASSSKSKSR
jgi:hypothetical protein